METSLEYQKIKEIDDFLFEAYRKINIYKYLTPKNLIEENNIFLEKFKSGIEYNPIYEYEKNIDYKKSEEVLNKIFELRKEIDELKIVSELGILVKRELKMLQDLEYIIMIYNNIGKNDKTIDLYSKKIYGEPNNELVKKAMAILEKDYKIEEECKYDAKECKELFKNVLKEMKLINWNIKINEVQSSKISVIPEEKEIHINGKVLFSKNDLKRLIVHEIGTHVSRAENGSKQPYKIFSIECANVLYSEEGLATVNEEKYNVLDRRTFRLYAGRVLAVSECMKKSFYESFKELIEYFSYEEALSIISRVKRGTMITEKPTLFVKDYIYLNGYYKVKKFLEKNDVKLLYTGIVGIDEADEINMLIEKKIIKEMEIPNLQEILKNIKVE